MRQNKMSRFRRFIFAGMTGIVIFALVELGLYLGGVGPAYKPDILGWRLPPNAKNHSVTDNQNQNTFIVNTNADSLRSSVKREKPPHLVRIALLGDSTVFSWGVEDDETLAFYLQKELRAQNPRGMDDIEVINAGQPGYSSAQVYKLFEDAVQYYNPDWIIAFPPFHDDRPAYVSDWEALNRVSWTRALGVLLARYSRIYHLLYTKIKGPLVTDITDEPNVSSIVRVNDAERTEIYTAIQKIADRWNGKVVMAAMIFGEDIRVNPHAADDYPMWNWMKGLKRDNPESELLDLRYCCAGSAISYTIPGDVGHLNPIGNQRVANCIAEKWHPNIPK